MSTAPDPVPADAHYDAYPDVEWRVSTFSRPGDPRVETALLPDGRIAVRNTARPEDGLVFFTRAEMDAWIKGVKANEFDDLM